MIKIFISLAEHEAIFTISVSESKAQLTESSSNGVIINLKISEFKFLILFAISNNCFLDSFVELNLLI